MTISKNAIESVSAALTSPRQRTEEEVEFDRMVKSCKAKEKGHRQKPIPTSWGKHKVERLYTVTTMAASARYGGKRTVGVFDWKTANHIVKKNAGDIYEFSYKLVVIEGVIKNYLYAGLLNEAYWFKWFGDAETGGYKPIEVPEPMIGICNHGIG